MRYASIGDFRRAFTALWLRVLITMAFAVALIPLAPYLAFTLHRPYLTPMIDVLAIYAFAYKAARYTAIIISLIAIALALFSKQAVYIVYGPQYGLVPLYLSIMAISNLLTPFGVVTMYLNIIGATRTTMVLNIVSMLIGLPITWTLLVHYGMLGAVIASLINGVLGTAISLIVARRMYGIVIDITQVVKYWTPSLIAGTLTYPAMRIMSNMWLALGIGSVIYLASLIVLTALMTNTEDLKNLTDISRGINYVGPLVSRALNYLAKIRMMLWS
jgi:O-antigen/teichoic acid export membrane protein